MNKIIGLEKLGSTKLIPFAEEAFEIMKKYLKPRENLIEDLKHIRFGSEEEFKKSVEDFKKKYPNSNIRITGFVISSKRE
jgi:hypothetical protein